jgi:hypothetical protein
MSNIENAVLKSRDLINSAIEKNKLNGKYFEFSFPWIFNEFLGFLREEKKLKIEFYRRNYKIKHLIYKWYLNCFHFTNSLKVGKYDVLFIGSYSGHYKIYKKLENELLVNGLTYIYLTDKIALYKEIKADGGKVVFLNINLTSKLTNSFNGRNEAFDNLINETINLNIKYFQNLETIFIKTFKALLVSSILPFAILIIFGADIFALAFGEKWRGAGEYSQILGVMFFFRFTVSPLTYVFYVANKQRLDFYLHLLFIIVGFLSLYLGIKIFENINLSLWLFSISYSIIYIIYFVFSYNYCLKK